jgi:hypothetical protein
MKSQDIWRKGMLAWFAEDALYISVVFTWNLPLVRKVACEYPDIVVGGPAVESMPNYFSELTNVRIGEPIPGILQRHRADATRTSTGCIRRCLFCSVHRREGDLRELTDWPDGSVLVDNNLLACSQEHFDKVIDRLKGKTGVDFNQGLDARLLTEHHAERLAELPDAAIRLALDSMAWVKDWERAYDLLRAAKFAKRRIRSYALIAHTTGVDEAWERVSWIEKQGVKPLPMWFHETNTLEHNVVTMKQAELGWTDYERRRIMQWFYQHKRAVQPKAA